MAVLSSEKIDLDLVCGTVTRWMSGMKEIKSAGEFPILWRLFWAKGDRVSESREDTEIKEGKSCFRRTSQGG